jgi:hypothetical protein
LEACRTMDSSVVHLEHLCQRGERYQTIMIWYP